LKDVLPAKKSVLFIIPSLKPGGAEYQTIQQVNQLHKEDHNIFLLVLSVKKSLILDEIQLPKQKIYCLDLKNDTLNFKSAFFLNAIKKIKKISACLKPDVLVANLPLGHWYGRLIKMFYSKAKLITYNRSLQFDANPIDTFPKRLFFSLQKMLLKKYDDVSICVSKAVQHNIQKHYVLVNPVVIYNSVCDRYNEFSNSYTDDNRYFEIVIPGRLHPSKGHLFFIECFNQLIKEKKISPEQFKIIFAGGGPIENKLKDNIQFLGLNAYFEITGSLNNIDLLQKIVQSNLIIIPSIHEGLGNVAIESLMLGKTIISSDAGGLTEIITNNKNGYVFKSLDIPDFKRVFLSVISNLPDSIFNTETIRDSYLSKFTFEAHLELFIKVLYSDAPTENIH